MTSIIIRWPSHEEARIYLRLTFWAGMTRKQLADHLGVSQLSSIRMFQGKPVSDKTVARALLLHRDKTFADLFEVKLDSRLELLKAGGPYPETYEEAVEAGFEVKPFDLPAGMTDPHVNVMRGADVVMRHTKDGSIWLPKAGREDPGVLAVCQRRFGATPGEVAGIGGLLNAHLLERFRERAAQRRDEA